MYTLTSLNHVYSNLSNNLHGTDIKKVFIDNLWGKMCCLTLEMSVLLIMTDDLTGVNSCSQMNAPGSVCL